MKSELGKILNSGKNLGMAITSKILRIADPETFVVFDSVFYKNFKQEDKRNFSFNATGYIDFLKEMKKYKKALNNDSKAKDEIRLGDLEFAIYQLVQFVLKEFNWQDKCSRIGDVGQKPTLNDTTKKSK